MQDYSEHLASTLKHLRKENGWSLDRTSKETGVSKAMLGQIERGESSPTVATLWKIAGGFKCSLSSFIASDITNNEKMLLRSSENLRSQPCEGEMLVATLFPFNARKGFEMFELTLPSGYERISEPHEPGVTEHIVVIAGEMELLLNDTWRELKAGDVVQFDASKPHGYRNKSEQNAVFHDVIHYS